MVRVPATRAPGGATRPPTGTEADDDRRGRSATTTPRLGALDTADRPTDEECSRFEDLDESSPSRPATPPARPRGSSTTPSATLRASRRGRRRRPRRVRRRGGLRRRRGGAARASRTPPSPPVAGGPRGARRPTGARVPAGRGPRRHHRRRWSGVALAVVALVLFHFGPAPRPLLVFVIIALAGAEFFTAVRRGGSRPATLLGLTAVAALPAGRLLAGRARHPAGAVPHRRSSGCSGSSWAWAQTPPSNLGRHPARRRCVGGARLVRRAASCKIPAQGVSILLVAVLAAVGYDVGASSSAGRRPDRR